MRSFLREMEEKFVELENHCEVCDKPADQCKCNEEVDEASATGGVDGELDALKIARLRSDSKFAHL